LVSDMLRSASLATKPPAYLFRYPSMSKSTETKSTSCAPSRCAASQPVPKFSFAFQCLAALSGDRRGVFRFGEGLFTDHLTTPQETFSEKTHPIKNISSSYCFIMIFFSMNLADDDHPECRRKNLSQITRPDESILNRPRTAGRAGPDIVWIDARSRTHA
ncbi:hypothetical protein, partial [Paenirhodobacter hankyongi]|uniref:hypothetical protein n=1 Tax=Paenirhodobacter hankyongi TaxID=2294033 RepID=UPI001C7CF8C8